MDGVDPEIVDEIKHVVDHVFEVKEIGEVRVRWLGHRLHAEINIALDSNLSVEKGHAIACEVRHKLLHHLKYLDNAVIHVDPVSALGEKFHCIESHSHDGTKHSHK